MGLKWSVKEDDKKKAAEEQPEDDDNDTVECDECHKDIPEDEAYECDDCDGDFHEDCLNDEARCSDCQKEADENEELPDYSNLAIMTVESDSTSDHSFDSNKEYKEAYDDVVDAMKRGENTVEVTDDNSTTVYHVRNIVFVRLEE